MLRNQHPKTAKLSDHLSHFKSFYFLLCQLQSCSTVTDTLHAHIVTSVMQMGVRWGQALVLFCLEEVKFICIAIIPWAIFSLPTTERANHAHARSRIHKNSQTVLHRQKGFSSVRARQSVSAILEMEESDGKPGEAECTVCKHTANEMWPPCKWHFESSHLLPRWAHRRDRRLANERESPGIVRNMTPALRSVFLPSFYVLFSSLP